MQAAGGALDREATGVDDGRYSAADQAAAGMQLDPR